MKKYNISGREFEILEIFGNKKEHLPLSKFRKSIQNFL